VSKLKKIFVILIFSLVLIGTKDQVQAVELNQILKIGSRGEQVFFLQQLLTKYGYNLKIDGIFGVRTKEMVCKFQSNNGLKVDGIVGPQSWKCLLSNPVDSGKTIYTIQEGDRLPDLASRFGISSSELIKANPQINFELLQVGHTIIVPNSVILSRGSNNEIKIERKSVTNSGADLIPWNIVKNIYTDKAVVIDVVTGLSFNVKRLGGYNHADSEPLTVQDTEIMKKIYGGKWSWDRRSIIVVTNGYRIAASMNGKPHGSQRITNNNFNGHFCIHFLESKTHNNNNKIDPLHQQKVYLAKGK